MYQEMSFMHWLESLFGCNSVLLRKSSYLKLISTFKCFVANYANAQLEILLFKYQCYIKCTLTLSKFLMGGILWL